MEVDGLVFRRKRRATPISSGTSSKAKLVDSEDKVDTGPFQGISEKEAATMSAFALRADDKGSTVMEESLPGSHETSGNTALEERSGPPECSAATLAQNALEKLAESDSEAHRLQALCVNIPKASLAERPCTDLGAASCAISNTNATVGKQHPQLVCHSSSTYLSLLSLSSGLILMQDTGTCS